MFSLRLMRRLAMFIFAVSAWNFGYPITGAVLFLLVAMELAILAERKLAQLPVDSFGGAYVSYPFERKNLYTRTQYAWDPTSSKDDQLSEEPPVFHEANTRLDGYIRIPAFNATHSFTYSTDEHGRRITSQPAERDAKRPILSVYGCSCAWGTGVSDEQTFPYRLQALLPEYTVVNYGVSGFSLNEIYSLMRQTIHRDQPELVLVCHHPVQDGRTTGKYPSCRWHQGRRCLSLKLPWKSKRTRYNLPKPFFTPRVTTFPLPPVRAFLHSLLSLPALPFNNESVIQQTAQHLFLIARDRCRHHNAEFMIVNLSNRTPHASFFREQGFTVAQCAFESLGLPENPENPRSLWPFDHHSNAETHREIAETIAAAIDSKRTGKPLPQVPVVEVSSAPEQTGPATGLEFIYPMF